MKKAGPSYKCVNCGHSEPKWLGRCPECGQWNSFRESVSSTGKDKAGETYPVPLESIDSASGTRIGSGSSEFDRVLGGGFLRGSAILLAGEPGIGKSTLLLQLCAKVETKGRILYISGEESPAHIKLRAERLGRSRPGLEVFCSGDLGRIRTVLDTVKPVFVVVDSMQTLHSEEAGAVPGTANQVKYCARELVTWVKEHDACMVLVAHVTKDGMIAGPKSAEHLVDVVLGFEQAEGDIRTLRASKNRFGSTEEIGLFRMTGVGLVEVGDPSGFFLVRRDGRLPAGVAVTPVHEGSRILLVEIQALVVPAKAGLTRVYSDRIDVSRVSRIAAVLEKHTGMQFSDQDIYVNVAGGMRLIEPAIDLALACALYSARSGTALPEGNALAGELSLAGEIRPVPYMKRRVKAAAGLGFSVLIGPSEGPLDSWTVAGSTAGTMTVGISEAGDWKMVGDMKQALRALWTSAGAKNPVAGSREAENGIQAW